MVAAPTGACRCLSRSCESAGALRRCRRAVRATTAPPSGGALGGSRLRVLDVIDGPRPTTTPRVAPTAAPNRTVESTRPAPPAVARWRAGACGQLDVEYGVPGRWRGRPRAGAGHSWKPGRQRPRVLHPLMRGGRRWGSWLAAGAVPYPPPRGPSLP